MGWGSIITPTHPPPNQQNPPWPNEHENYIPPGALQHPALPRVLIWQNSLKYLFIVRCQGLFHISSFKKSVVASSVCFLLLDSFKKKIILALLILLLNSRSPSFSLQVDTMYLKDERKEFALTLCIVVFDDFLYAVLIPYLCRISFAC